MSCHNERKDIDEIIDKYRCTSCNAHAGLCKSNCPEEKKRIASNGYGIYSSMSSGQISESIGQISKLIGQISKSSGQISCEQCDVLICHESDEVIANHKPNCQIGQKKHQEVQHYGKYRKYLRVMDQQSKNQLDELIDNLKHCKGFQEKGCGQFWCFSDQHEALQIFVKQYDCPSCNGRGEYYDYYDDWQNCFPFVRCERCDQTGIVKITK